MLRDWFGTPSVIACFYGWVALEAISWLHYLLTFQAFYPWFIPRATEGASTDHQNDKTTGQREVERFVDAARHSVFDLREFLEGWFRAPLHAIAREDMIAWLRRVCVQADDVDASWYDAVIADMSGQLNIHFDSRESDGRGKLWQHAFGKSARPMLFTHEPLDDKFVPSSFYLMFTLLRSASRVALWLQGYRRHSAGCLVYWYRPTGAAAHQAPHMFFHGVGPLHIPYLLLLRQIQHSRAMLLPELPWMSLAGGSVPKTSEIVHSLQLMVKRHASTAQGMQLMGHSAGSFYMSSYLMQAAPGQVERAVFLDPHCLLLCTPHVVSNFLYRRPTDMLDWLRYRFISQEISMQRFFRRSFRWMDHQIWLEHCATMPEHCLFVLGGKDEICPTYLLRKYISERKRASQIVWNPNHRHGQFMLSPATLRHIGRFCTASQTGQ